MEGVEARLREMLEELSNFRNLTESVGWKRLEEIADGQLKNRMPSILEKTENVLELAGKEFEKGEMSGIYLFMQLPGTAMEGLEADIAELEEQIENVPRARDTDGTDDGSDDGDTFVGDAPTV